MFQRGARARAGVVCVCVCALGAAHEHACRSDDEALSALRIHRLMSPSLFARSAGDRRVHLQRGQLFRRERASAAASGHQGQPADQLLECLRTSPVKRYCLSVSLCLSVSVSLCLCVSVSLCLCVFLSLCLSLSLSLSLCPSLSLSSLCVCVCAYLSVRLCYKCIFRSRCHRRRRHCV